MRDLDVRTTVGRGRGMRMRISGAGGAIIHARVATADAGHVAAMYKRK